LKKILLISALFPPEPVVSAKLSEDIANPLSIEHHVSAIAPLPTRPFGFKFSKKPIIASVDLDCDSARLINEANAGWIVEPENIYLLIKGMKVAYAASNSELKLKGENGFNYAMKHLSKKNNLKQIVNIILEQI